MGEKSSLDKKKYQKGVDKVHQVWYYNYRDKARQSQNSGVAS
jgi:predicted transposase